MSHKDATIKRLRPRINNQEREDAVFAALGALDGWADVSTIRRLAARTHVHFTAAPGTTRTILDRITEAGLCERRIQGANAMFRANTPSKVPNE